MRYPWTTFLRRVAIGAALLCASWRASAQSSRRVIEEPRWLTLHVREISAGAYAEGNYESVSYDNSSTTVTHNRIFVGPLVGLNAYGSIYHPNLMRYHVDTEGALGWAQDTVDNGRTSFTREEFQYLGRFNSTVNILSSKPYNGSVFAGYDHSVRDYDFFNRVIIDSWRYGARAAYSIDNIFLNASYTHREEDVSGLRVDSMTFDDTVTFSGRHEREHAGTTLNYTYNEYSRVDLGRTGEGIDHTISLGDYERFGSREQFALNSTATYTKRESVVDPSDQATLAANLNAEHKHNLSSYYDANYEHFETGDFKSDSVFGSADLRHQLYDSLSSTLHTRAGAFESGDKLSTSSFQRYGGGFTEAYHKRVAANHRLRISNTLLVDHFDQDLGGIAAVRRVENERHSFVDGPGGSSFFLDLVRVTIGTIEVTDSNDTQPAFVRGIDYEITLLGERTLITRPPGSRIGPSDVLLVDYQAEATGSGSYESLTETFQVRFEMWTNLWAVYTRVNLWRNNANRDLRVPNLTSYAVGTDLSWRWLRSGAEYEIYDSDLSRYRAARVYESASFLLDAASTFSIDLSQSWIDYEDANRQEQNYRFISRYHHVFTPRMQFDIEGGVDVRRGENANQTLATVRPGFNYSIGKTSVKAGYDFEYNMFEHEERFRHLFFVRLKRVF
jgi:hypothetical protein